MSAAEIVETIPDLEAWAVQQILSRNGQRSWRFTLEQRCSEWRLVARSRAGLPKPCDVRLSRPLAEILSARWEAPTIPGNRRAQTAAEIVRVVAGKRRERRVQMEAKEAAWRRELFELTVSRLWPNGGVPHAWEARTHTHLGGQTYRSAAMVSFDGLLDVIHMLRPSLARVEPWGLRVREVAGEAVVELLRDQDDQRHRWRAAEVREFLVAMVSEFACEAVNWALRTTRAEGLIDLPSADELWSHRMLPTMWWLVEWAHGANPTNLWLSRLRRLDRLTTKLRDIAMAELLAMPGAPRSTSACDDTSFDGSGSEDVS